MLGYYLGFYYCEDIPWPWQTLFSKAFSWNLPTVSEGSFIIMVGNMMSCRQTCRWGSSWEFYIWVGGQEEEQDAELGMGSLKPQSPSLWHTSFNKVLIINPFKQCHTLVIKYSYLWVYRGHSHSNHYSWGQDFLSTEHDRAGTDPVDFSFPIYHSVPSH